MSEQVIKNYIFLDSESFRVLAVKRSHDLDFCISSKQWLCYCIESSASLKIRSNLLQTWDPIQGLKATSTPTAEENIKLLVLQKKIEILLSIKATLHVIEKQMKPQLSMKRLLALPIKRSHFYKIWKLIKVEKHILKKRIVSFYADLQVQVEEASTIEKLNELYLGLNKNLTLGGYAAFSLDLEEDHVKNS